MPDPNKFPEGTQLIELRGVYDGWSVAILPNGTVLNRWDPIAYPRRYAATEKFIKSSK
jgi:hypothetical protein